MKTKTQMFNIIYTMLDESSAYSLHDIYISEDKTYTQLTFVLRSEYIDYQIDIKNNDGIITITWITYRFNKDLSLKDKENTFDDIEDEFKNTYPHTYKILVKNSDILEFELV